jgi:diguanylate cyclase (GGDEF)-like protein
MPYPKADPVIEVNLRERTQFPGPAPAPAARRPARCRLKWHTLCRLVTLVAVCLLAGVARADDGLADPRPSERGLPTVTVVPPSRLGAPQLFAVSVTGRRLYVGTLTGLAIHDGAHWETVPSERALYAVHGAPSGRVIAGGPDSLIELSRGADGQRQLVSLLDHLPEADRVIGDVRSIHALGDTFFAVTDRALVRVRGADVHVVERWRSDPLRRGFTSQERLYVTSQSGVRAFAADATTATDAVTALDAADGRVMFVVDHPQAGQVVGVETRGLLAWHDGAWRAAGHGGGDRLTRGITDARVLASGALALGSTTGGVLLLTPELTFDRALGRAEGLPSGDVESLAEDAEGGVWIVSPAELARVDFGAPLTLIDSRLGLEGTVNGVARYDGTLHVLTTSGLFVLDDRHGRRRVTPVPGVPGRAWDAFDAGEHLLVATASGVYESRRSGARLVPGTARLSSYVLAPRVDRPDTMLVGSRTGLSVLVRQGNGWRFLRDVPGAPRYVRTIVTRPDGLVYLGTTFDGLVRLRLDEPAVPPRTLVPGEVHLRDIDGALHVLSYESNVLAVLDEARETLTPAPLRGVELPEHTLRFAFDPRGALWATGRGVETLDRGMGAMRPILDRGVSVQALDIEDDGVVWLGSNVGLWRFASPRATPWTSRPSPTLERVFVNGAPVARARPDGSPIDLAFGFERLRLEFTPNTFASGTVTAFKLEPLDADWSAARHGVVAEYTSLPEGTYRLHMRSGSGPERAESEWAFTVRPPWYRTPLVYLLEIGVAAGLLLLVSQVRTHQLRRRSHDLERAVIEKTAALQEANRRLAELAWSDELTALYNRRHFEEALAEEWARAHRTRSPIALVMVDIDHFKSLNDTLGHVAGDRALRAVADVIKACARRPGDVAARYGGEEFVVLLPGGRRERVHALAEEIRQAVEALALPHPGHALGRITVSVGVAAVTAPESLQATLVDAADRALYRAKAAGRNAVAA